jgi:5-methylcytosine-specific restriction enzyme A
MSDLSDLAPIKRQRIIDLVKYAGVDVSDWANFKGGEKNAATNPKYCYEWSFIQPNKVVVINLWFADLKELDGTIQCRFNMHEAAHKAAQLPNNTVRQGRCLKLDRAVQVAFRENLPIRVVICDGERRSSDDSKASHVSKRLLDEAPWAVTAYDSNTGQCTVTRGAYTDHFVDQFLIHEESPLHVEQRSVSAKVFQRSAEIRRRALLRANGRCEWCAQPGFKMLDGRVFLETHHVIPLSEGGPDTDRNVAALCPNHHREAHHGEIRENMRKELLNRLGKRDRN